MSTAQNKMSLSVLLRELQQTQPTLLFAEVLATIKQHYHYTPTSFRNGPLFNAKGENEGSCIIFAFAALQQLNPEQTLQCFGEHYQLVQATPHDNTHRNIRQFMQTGPTAVTFTHFPLTKK